LAGSGTGPAAACFAASSSADFESPKTGINKLEKFVPLGPKSEIERFVER